VLAWKIMAFIGMALALLSFVSLTTEALGTGGYSATALTMGYLGVVLLAIGSSNLYQKRYVFFLTIFLSTTALYILALYRYEVVGSTPLSNISVLPGTIFLLMFVGIATYVILKLNSSLTNKRKLYQTFSLIMFNLGALGIVAKHLIAPGLHCYACPWATAGCPIGLLQNWVIMGEVPYYLFGSFMAIFAVVGRAFCGWACPFGFLHDVIDKISSVKYTRRNTQQALRRIYCTITHTHDEGMPRHAALPHKDGIGYLTYLTRTMVLVLTIYAAWAFVNTWFCKLCPAGLIEAALPYRLSHNVAPDPLFIWRIALFAAMLIIAIVVSRFWCRYFCPLGHLAGHFNYVSLLNLELDEQRCTSCGLCKKACPMELNPEGFLRHEEEHEKTLHKVACSIKKERTNCILCGECVEACKHNAGALTIRFGAVGWGMDKKIIRQASKSSKLVREKVHSREQHPGTGGLDAAMKSLDIGEEPQRPIRVHTEGRPPAKQVGIDIFFKSYTEIPRTITRLSEMGGYHINKIDIAHDKAAMAYYVSHYKDYLQLPVIVVNGQVYTGPTTDMTRFMEFVQRIKESYAGIYIGALSDECERCTDERCSKALGTSRLEQDTVYPLSRFRAQSPGAILTSCHNHGLRAFYGRVSPPIRGAAHYKKEMQKNVSQYAAEFRHIPPVTIELYLKEDSDLSHDILNIVAQASFYSGGKLRYFITRGTNKIPEISVNGTQIPSHLHPSSFATLFFIIRQYVGIR
jgi:polyferredoxin